MQAAISIFDTTFVFGRTEAIGVSVLAIIFALTFATFAARSAFAGPTGAAATIITADFSFAIGDTATFAIDTALTRFATTVFGAGATVFPFGGVTLAITTVGFALRCRAVTERATGTLAVDGTGGTGFFASGITDTVSTPGRALSIGTEARSRTSTVFGTGRTVFTLVSITFAIAAERSTLAVFAIHAARTFAIFGAGRAVFSVRRLTFAIAAGCFALSEVATLTFLTFAILCTGRTVFTSVTATIPTGFLAGITDTDLTCGTSTIERTGTAIFVFVLITGAIAAGFLLFALAGSTDLTTGTTTIHRTGRTVFGGGIAGAVATFFDTKSFFTGFVFAAFAVFGTTQAIFGAGFTLAVTTRVSGVAGSIGAALLTAFFELFSLITTTVKPVDFVANTALASLGGTFGGVAAATSTVDLTGFAISTITVSFALTDTFARCGIAESSLSAVIVFLTRGRISGATPESKQKCTQKRYTKRPTHSRLPKDALCHSIISTPSAFFTVVQRRLSSPSLLAS